MSNRSPSTRPVLLLGARSDIALACAHAFGAAGHPLILAARDPARLEPARTDLALRYGVEVQLLPLDVLDETAESFVARLPVLPQIAISAVGLLGDQAESQRESAAAALVLRTNFEGPALLLGALAEAMEARGSGTLVGISSVAGERGRASNYVYGAAKAGFTAYLAGLRHRLAGSGVHVLTVLPGFVATAMTEGMDLPERLTAEPQEVGAAIYRAVEKRRNLVYVRPVWQLIMAIIRNIPEPIFKKTKL